MTRPSEHFAWSEVTRSPTARRRGIDNSLPEHLRANAIYTAEQMEAVRALLGDRIIDVNSWFRCPALNAAVGGSKTSVHPKALAVDFEPRGMPLLVAFESLAASDVPFDQLIHERTASGADWIHIGFTLGTPRREVLRASGATLGGPMAFTREARG